MATENGNTEEVDSPDIHFDPIVQLPSVQTVTLEEQEHQLLELRAKLFRYDNSEEDGPEWKERGTGYVKLLRHKESNFVRVLMRRDKTLKICANHYIQPSMELKPNCGSEKAWVWTTTADFSDEEPHPELLAIRFANAENAQKFKEKFDEAKEIMKTAIEKHRSREAVPASPNGATSSEDEVENAKDAGTEKTDSEKGAGDTKTPPTETTETDSVAQGLEKLTVNEDNASADSKSETSSTDTGDTSQKPEDKPKDSDVTS